MTARRGNLESFIMSLPAATYGDFRTVLKRTGFELIRSRKHEV